MAADADVPTFHPIPTRRALSPLAAVPDDPDLHVRLKAVEAEVDLSRERLALLIDRAFRRQGRTLLYTAVALIAVDLVVAVSVAVWLA